MALPALRHRLAPLLVGAALALALPVVAAAPVPRPSPRGGAAPAAATVPEPPVEAPDSPRASVRSFLELTGKGRYKEAARYLSLDAADRDRGPTLASRLRAVLDRRLNVDLDALSPLSEGSRNDGLPPGTETLGSIAGAQGSKEAVLLVRAHDEGGGYWAFSRRTVERIDDWYDALADRWIRDFLPQPLLRHGPRGLLLWQWLALPVLVVVAFAIGRVLGAVTSAILRRALGRQPWNERVLDRVSPAITLLWAVAMADTLLPLLALLPAAHGFIRSLFGAGATIAIFWALWRSVDVLVQSFVERPAVAGNPSARSLLSVSRNLLKALVALGGVVATIAAFGYPVTTVLAGLGIGGIAVAFGAQKTVENLFGSVAIAADQPFRVGDAVKIEDFSGTVERIGLRSTQIRTLDRSLITIPNGKLSDTRVESFAARDRIRFATVVRLAFGATEGQVRQVLEGIERTLRAHPKVWPDVVVTKLLALGPSSLDIEVLCWFATTDFDEFRICRQDALLGILRVVNAAGASFALPDGTTPRVTASGSAAAAGKPQPRRE